MNRLNLIQVGLIRLTTVTGVVLTRYVTSRRYIFQVVAATLFVLAVPVAAHASSQASDIGSGRLLPTMAAVIGLVGVVIGRLALVRLRRTRNGRAMALVGAVLGLISLVIGGLHTVNSAGGFGSGNGLAGAIVAIVLGLVALVISGLALARSRRIATGNNTTMTTSSNERT